MRELDIVVIGLGAIGCETARYLGLLGLSRISLIDFDVIDESSIKKSIFYRQRADVGRSKVHVLSEAMRTYFPETQVVEFPQEVSDVGYQVFRSADLLLSCVDSDWARMEIAYLARQLSLPVCDAGLGSPNLHHGRVTMFSAAPGDACYGCILSPRHRREILLEMDQSQQSCWSAPAHSGESAAIPSTPMMASMIAAIQVDFGLRSMDGEGAWSLEIELKDVPRMEKVNHRRSTSCPLHEPVQVRVAGRMNQTAREVLQDVARESSVLLDSPVCISAACRDCSYKWAPMIRAAKFRRTGVCAACGSKLVSVLQTLHHIGADSPWAEVPFSALGLPDHHLYGIIHRSD